MVRILTLYSMTVFTYFVDIATLKYLLPLIHWDREFESHSSHDVCLRLFCVCVVLCVDSGIATGWSPYRLLTRFTVPELILDGNRPESIIRQDRRRTQQCNIEHKTETTRNTGSDKKFLWTTIRMDRSYSPNFRTHSLTMWDFKSSLRRWWRLLSLGRAVFRWTFPSRLNSATPKTETAGYTETLVVPNPRRQHHIIQS
jgi:hypothetical protein